MAKSRMKSPLSVIQNLNGSPKMFTPLCWELYL